MAEEIVCELSKEQQRIVGGLNNRREACHKMMQSIEMLQVEIAQETKAFFELVFACSAAARCLNADGCIIRVSRDLKRIVTTDPKAIEKLKSLREHVDVEQVDKLMTIAATPAKKPRKPRKKKGAN